jgi:N-acetylneuraminic acid mutarotase
LPRNLHSSSLCIADGYLYLYGGYEVNYASEVIFKASVTNPLAWVDTGASLPTKLYGSQLGIVDGYIYLFGGLLAADSPTSNIYRAARTSATSWSVVGAMPMASCYSQFFTVASKGYLIGPTFPTATLTRILSCNLSTPLLWSDTLKTIPGQVAQSQIGIIGDRLFLFGGNGSSVIFADNSIVKYTPTDPVAVSYGSITRTQYNATANPLDLFKLLGFPYWKTNYGS